MSIALALSGILSFILHLGFYKKYFKKPYVLKHFLQTYYSLFVLIVYQKTLIISFFKKLKH